MNGNGGEGPDAARADGAPVPRRPRGARPPSPGRPPTEAEEAAADSNPPRRSRGGRALRRDGGTRREATRRGTRSVIRSGGRAPAVLPVPSGPRTVCSPDTAIDSCIARGRLMRQRACRRDGVTEARARSRTAGVGRATRAGQMAGEREWADDGRRADDRRCDGRATRDRADDPGAAGVPAAARLAAADVGSRCGLAYEEVDDLRIAVDELCHAIMGRRPVPRRRRRARDDPRDPVLDLPAAAAASTIEATCANEVAPRLNELSAAILAAVVDEHELPATTAGSTASGW